MAFDFKDINLIPEYFDGDSRSELNPKIQFGKYTFKNPVIAANMVSVINEDIAIKLAENGYFYIMHRFNIDNYKFVKDMHDLGLIASISVGIKQEDYDLIDRFKNDNICPEFITVDIAHGHCKGMKKMIKYIKSNLDTFVIAGNVSTSEAANHLNYWGADAIKVGIGPGASCTTYHSTGFGSRNIQASVIKDITTYCKAPVIADGGLEYPGDITKALVLGAKMCMTGTLLSGCTDSPGVNNNGSYEYFGSASEFNNKTNRIEGTKILLASKNKSILEQMEYLNECLQSSMSYGGVTNIKDLNTKYYIVKNNRD